MVEEPDFSQYAQASSYECCTGRIQPSLHRNHGLTPDINGNEQFQINGRRPHANQIRSSFHDTKHTQHIMRRFPSVQIMIDSRIIIPLSSLDQNARTIGRCRNKTSRHRRLPIFITNMPKQDFHWRFSSRGETKYITWLPIKTWITSHCLREISTQNFYNKSF